MRTSGKVLVGVAIIACAAMLAKDRIIKHLVVRQVTQSTGFKMEIGGVNSSILRHSFEVTKVKLLNPPDFPDVEAFDINRLRVNYAPMSFLTSTVQLHELVIEIPQVVMIKKADGESNFDRIRRTAESKAESPSKPAPGETEDKAPESSGGEGTPPPNPPKPAKAEKKLHVDKLTIVLGKIETRDYGKLKDGKPRTSTMEINLDRTFTNVDDIQSVVMQMALESVIQSGLHALTEQLQKSGDGEKSGDVFKQIGRNLGELFKHPKGK